MGGFFHRILSQAVENILTARHPVASCISTYEKIGGFPEDGKFAVRGNIEDWVRRDLIYTGVEPEDLEKMDYFDAYLRYWEQYNYYVATTGLSANRAISIVAYDKQTMESVMKSLYYRFGNLDPEPGEFEVFGKRDRHPDWFEKAELVIKRVSGVWATVGLAFPLEDIMEGW